MKKGFLVLFVLAHFCLVSKSQIITTIAGNGTFGYTGNGGPAISAELEYPAAVVFDRHGNLFVGCESTVRKIDTTGIITTVVGTGTDGFNGDNIPAVQAQINSVQSLAFDKRGNLYISDFGNNRIRMVDTNGIITTFAGNGIPGFSGDGGPATAAEIFAQEGIGIDAIGDLYIADGNDNRVRKVDTFGIITTIAGTGTGGYNGDGILATTAELSFPEDVAFDAQGNIYICEIFGNRVRKIDTSGIITTFAGTGTGGYNGDGILATTAQINHPNGLLFDPQGNLLITDGDNDRIRKIDLSGIINTIAGDGTGGFSGDGGSPILAELDYPYMIAYDSKTNLFIGDDFNWRVREVLFKGVVSGFSASNTILCQNDCINFTNLSSNASAYQWSFPGGAPSSSTAVNPTVCYNSPGQYNVQLIASNGNLSDTLLMPLYITVNAAPVAGVISSSRDSICEGSGLKSILSISGSSVNLQWQSSPDGIHFSDLPGDTSSTYTTPPSLAQTTWYRLLASNSCGADSSNIVPVNIVPPPVAKFTNAINGKQAIFNSDSSSSNVTSYSWNFGDSTISTLANPTHTFNRADTFYVCLTVYNGSNCSYTLCKDVDITVVAAGVNSISPPSSIQLYPNPANTTVNLSVEGIEGNYQLKIYNMLGQQVEGISARHELPLHNNQIISVNLETLINGTYRLILFNDKEYYSKQFELLK